MLLLCCGRQRLQTDESLRTVNRRRRVETNEELWSSKIRHDGSESLYLAPDGMLVLQKSRLETNEELQDTVEGHRLEINAAVSNGKGS